jgi:hypothetical protein
LRFHVQGFSNIPRSHGYFFGLLFSGRDHILLENVLANMVRPCHARLLEALSELSEPFAIFVWSGSVSLGTDNPRDGYIAAHHI